MLPHSESLSLTGVKLVGSCNMCFTVELLFDKPIAVSVTENERVTNFAVTPVTDLTLLCHFVTSAASTHTFVAKVGDKTKCQLAAKRIYNRTNCLGR